MAKQLVWLMLISELVFALLIRAVNETPEAKFFHYQHAYSIVLDPILRFVLAGSVANLLAIFSIFISYLNGKFSRKANCFGYEAYVQLPFLSSYLYLLQ